MSETNLRVANFLKSFSMILVIGSLLYFYAYASDRLNFLYESDNWIIQIPKSYIFYSGLGFFALSNLLMNVGILMYKNADGLSEQSIFFKSKIKKQKLLTWFAYMIAGVNFFVTTIVLYITMVKINELAGDTEYIFLPMIGLLILTGIIVGLLVEIGRK